MATSERRKKPTGLRPENSIVARIRADGTGRSNTTHPRWTRRIMMRPERMPRWAAFLRLAVFGLLTALAGIIGPVAGVAWAEDELFVANQNEHAPSVTVYARTASGNTAPLRRLAGPNTGFIKPRAVAIDTVRDELYVSDSADSGGLGAPSIRVYK